MLVVRLLGPVDVIDEQGQVRASGSALRRSVLALLALEPGRVVDPEWLLDQAWDTTPPQSGLRALRFHISKLRSELGESGAIVTVGSGYRLDAEVDVARVESELASGPRGADQYEALLGVWRGEPLADVAGCALLEHERVRLTELQLSVLEGLYRARIQEQDGPTVIGALTRVCLDNPLREGLWASLIAAHYQAGHQADALRAYDRLRVNLAESLGVDPAPALQELEQQILAQDPDLAGLLPLTSHQPGINPAPAAWPTPIRGNQGTGDVRFVDVDGLGIAWEQYGRGPECVVIPPLVSNIELQWENELYRRVLELMGRHLHVTHFDKRGMGLSDRWDGTPTLDQRIHDIVAVMDAAGLDRAHVLGISEGGLMAQLFAANHPERVDRLVLANSAVLGVEPSAEYSARALDSWPLVIEGWGRDASSCIGWWSPSNSQDEAFVRWFGRFQRQSATRADFERQLESMYALVGLSDGFLDDITAPTLVANSSQDQVVNSESGDYLARRIRNAERTVFDNDDHFYFLGHHWLEATTAIIEFMTGAAVAQPSERCFATVVVTRIVGPTAQLAALDDRAWDAAVDDHDRVAWALADRHAATIVKSTSDGLLARLESPSQAVAFCRDLAERLTSTGIRIRAGVHSGEIEIRPNHDITGVAVNLAAGVEQAAPDGAIYVSSTVRDILLGGAHRFEDRGQQSLKGIDGVWRLYEHVS
ncbi:MAG: alpha/beta fold hydrolase [Actinomycetia bacterium]|nr:alpha/beta fold hydrolase [Actinomycetes bacterium]